jgi:hypothetical protein
VGLTGLAALALLLGVVDLLDGSWSGLVFLAGGLFIGALVMRTALRRPLRSRVLVLDQQGLEDLNERGGVGRIAWSSVTYLAKRLRWTWAGGPIFTRCLVVGLAEPIGTEIRRRPGLFAATKTTSDHVEIPIGGLTLSPRRIVETAHRLYQGR